MSHKPHTDTPEDLDLEYARHLRKEIVQALTTNEQGQKRIPKDLRELQLIEQVLSGIDRAAISRKRIKQDEANSKQNGEAAALMADLLKRMSGTTMAVQADTQREAPSLRPDQVPPVVKPGLTDTDPGNETFLQFQEKMNQQDLDEK